MIYLVGLIVSMLVGVWAFHELITVFWPSAGIWNAGTEIRSNLVFCIVGIYYLIGALVGAAGFVAPFLLRDSLEAKRHARSQSEPTPESEPKGDEPDDPWMRPAWRAARPVIEENIKQYRATGRL